MKIKEILIGEDVILSGHQYSNCGCSYPYFRKCAGTKATILKKLNSPGVKNNVLIQVYDENKGQLIRFWCSANDLKKGAK